MQNRVMGDGSPAPPTPPRWWSVARKVFRFEVIVPVWAIVSVAVGVSTHDGGLGVAVGAAVALGIPYGVLWPAMRMSARRRGFRMTMRTEPL
jgi:high-affinity Fe2+/Pb2+ permease